MLVDDLYTELYAIAGRIGELDKTAVEDATLLLAQPRYTSSPDPAALLVEDLKSVIDSVPKVMADDERHTAETLPPYASRFFRSYARRYFSLDAAGETLSHRRAFGRKNVHGTVNTWTNRGVVYRVLAGLQELWAADSGVANATPDATYAIESVHVTRTLGQRRRPPFLKARRDKAVEFYTYELHILSEGPHRLVLPFSEGSVNDVVALSEAGHGVVCRVADGLPGCPHTILFGNNINPGERLRLSLTRTIRQAIGFWRLDSITYHALQPVGRLTLNVDMGHFDPDHYYWQILRHIWVYDRGRLFEDTEILVESASNLWRCDDLKFPMVYQMVGPFCEHKPSWTTMTIKAKGRRRKHY